MNDVKSAKRVLDILRFFSEEKAPASLAVLSSALNFPKSSCLALMETLVAEGYAYQSEGRYYLTGRWLRESEIVSRHDQVAMRCRPTLQRLSDELGETAILAQRAQKKVLYLDVIEAVHVLRFTAFPGQRKPIHAAASGRALLAALPDADARRIAESLDFERYTPHTPNNAAALMKAMVEGRNRGWHINLGEHQADTISIAVPLVLDGAVLALVVGAPANRLKNKLEQTGASLRSAAADLMASNKS